MGLLVHLARIAHVGGGASRILCFQSTAGGPLSIDAVRPGVEEGDEDDNTTLRI